MTGVTTTLGQQIQEANAFKTERDLGALKTMILVIKSDLPVVERHVIINQMTVGTAFILGHPLHARLGTDRLGAGNSSTVLSRVVNYNRDYIDFLNSTRFKNTASTTATWTGGDGIITFASNQIAISTPIYLNNETDSTATLIATATGAGSVSYWLSSNSGSNWISCTSGQPCIISPAGTALLWRASGSNMTLDTIEVRY